MTTYYVTQEQLDALHFLKKLPAPLVAIMNKSFGIADLYNELTLTDTQWFKYLGGDETIKFKVKEKLYRLSRIDNDGDHVYMEIDDLGTPVWTTRDKFTFKAPLEEIKKWKTPAWEIEEVAE